jgi:hypothetical protein
VKKSFSGFERNDFIPNRSVYSIKNHTHVSAQDKNNKGALTQPPNKSTQTVHLPQISTTPTNIVHNVINSSDPQVNKIKCTSPVSLKQKVTYYKPQSHSKEPIPSHQQPLYREVSSSQAAPRIVSTQRRRYHQVTGHRLPQSALCDG